MTKVQTKGAFDFSNPKTIRDRDGHSFSKKSTHGDWCQLDRYEDDALITPPHLDQDRIVRYEGWKIVYDHHDPEQKKYLEEVIRPRCKMAKVLLDWIDFFEEMTGKQYKYKKRKKKKMLKCKCGRDIVAVLERNNRLVDSVSLEFFWNHLFEIEKIKKEVLQGLPPCLVKIRYATDSQGGYIWWDPPMNHYADKLFGVENLNVFEDVRNNMVDPNSCIFPIKNRKNDIVRYVMIEDLWLELREIRETVEKTGLLIDGDLSLQDFIDFYGELMVEKKGNEIGQLIRKISHEDKKDRFARRDRERRVKRGQKNSWRLDLEI